MKPRLFLLLPTLTLVLISPISWADRLTELISGSDRSSNWLIIELIQSPEVESRLKAVEALGLREDPYVADIIASLVASYSRHTNYIQEHLLRVLLASVFPEYLPAENLRRKVRINREGLEPLLKGYEQFGDPLLKAEILRLLPPSGITGYESLLLAEVRRLEALLKRQGGRLAASETKLALALIDAIEASRNLDLLESCLSFYESSRQEVLTRRAWRAALSLATMAKPHRAPGEGG